MHGSPIPRGSPRPGLVRGPDTDCSVRYGRPEGGGPCGVRSLSAGRAAGSVCTQAFPGLTRGYGTETAARADLHSFDGDFRG